MIPQDHAAECQVLQYHRLGCLKQSGAMLSCVSSTGTIQHLFWEVGPQQHRNILVLQQKTWLGLFFIYSRRHEWVCSSSTAEDLAGFVLHLQQKTWLGLFFIYSRRHDWVCSSSTRDSDAGFSVPSVRQLLSISTLDVRVCLGAQVQV
ncbi:hypothetical protein ACOMHN_014401 [Nucella lapillus]